MSAPRFAHALAALVLIVIEASTGGALAAPPARKPAPKPAAPKPAAPKPAAPKPAAPKPAAPKPAAPKPAAPKPAAPPGGETAPPSANGVVEVTVSELAGPLAYLTPGQSAGVRRGAKVSVRGREFTVASATAAFAAVEDPEHTLREGDRARVTHVSEQVDAARELPPPRASSAFADAWPAPEAPASSQRPKHVPLGEVARDRRYEARFTFLAGGIVPLGERGDMIARTALEARVHAEPFKVPLAFDLDGAVQKWIGPGADARDGSGARNLWRVRELMVSYGAAARAWAGIGRLRYAASTLGTLDGLRVQTPITGGLRVSAFGGVLPDPTNGAPSLEAQRFGAELAYSAPEAPLRPELALVANGSTFDGKLDERRLSGVVGIFPGRSRLGGHFEVSSFPGDNPWGASSVELTKAGADASLRFGPITLGARFDLRQPERSRWLASYLPPSFFCLAAPASPATAAEPCDGRTAARMLGAADLSLELDHLVVTAGGTLIRDVGIPNLPSSKGGFASARVVRIARVFRVDVTGAYTGATYLDMTTIAGGPGVTLFHDQLDVGAYYRYATLAYRADNVHIAQHGGGGVATLLLGPDVALTAQGEATAGTDVSALLFLTSVTWRPRW